MIRHPLLWALCSLWALLVLAGCDKSPPPVSIEGPSSRLMAAAKVNPALQGGDDPKVALGKCRADNADNGGRLTLLQRYVRRVTARQPGDHE